MPGMPSDNPASFASFASLGGLLHEGLEAAREAAAWLPAVAWGNTEQSASSVTPRLLRGLGILAACAALVAAVVHWLQ